MASDSVVMVDYDRLCRLCLHSTGAMSDIFATYDGKSMQEQIHCITGLMAKEGDGLPSMMCHRCRHIIELSCELRDVVTKSNNILLGLAKENGDKESDNDDCETDNLLEEQSNTSQTEEKGLKKSENCDNDDSDSYYEDDEPMQENEESQESLPLSNSDENKRQVEESAKGLIVTGKTPMHLTCQLCLRLMDSEEDVRSHVEKHYEGSDLTNYLDITKRPFTCTTCDEMQLNKPQLVKHHRKHLGVNPFKCRHPGCSYEGKDRNGLRHHRIIHMAPSKHCEQCGTAFRRRFELLQHMERRHETPDRGQVCHTCGWRACSAPALAAHVRAHHYTPRYSCPYGSCERAYRSLSALRDHERAHRAGARVYRCKLCDLANFTSTSMLRRHYKTHSADASRKCGQCPATFEEDVALQRHCLAHHDQRYKRQSQQEVPELNSEQALSMQADEQEDTRPDDKWASSQEGEVFPQYVVY